MRVCFYFPWILTSTKLTLSILLYIHLSFLIYKPKKLSVVQLYPILCDPMEYSRTGSSVHGILQARILEWVTILFSRGSSWLNLGLLTAGRFFTIWSIRKAPRIVELVAIPFSKRSSWSRGQTWVSHTAGRLIYSTSEIPLNQLE